MTAPIASAPDGVPAPARHWAVVGLWIGMAMSVLDAGIVSVALPTIAPDIGSSPGSSIWVINAYQIAIIMGLLPAGALGATLGHRRVYLAGLVLFTVASVACALSQNLPALTVARFAQGLGAAAMMALNGALMRAVYPRALFARGIGWNGMVIAVTAAAGPSLAAALLSVASWPSLFAVNFPLALLALTLGVAFLPRSRAVGAEFDGIAALGTAAAFGALFICLAGLAGNLPVAWSAIAFPLGIGAALAVAPRLRRRDQPLVPIDLIRKPTLRGAYLASICAFAAQGSVLVTLPFILHRLGFGIAAIGLMITPLPVGVALASVAAGRLLGRWSSPRTAMIGLVVATASLIALVGVMVTWPVPPALALVMATFGCGFGLFQTSNNQIMLTGAPLPRAGAASTMLSLARLLGQLLGALIGATGLNGAGSAPMLPLIGAAVATAFALAVLLKHRRSD